jgi:hypothetical protein
MRVAKSFYFFLGFDDFSQNNTLEGKGFRENQVILKRNQTIFNDFYTILHFNKFCTMYYFDFFNSVLTKNLKIHSSIFWNFLFQIFSNFQKNQVKSNGFR